MTQSKKIIMLLDESGSMENIRSDIIGSVNSFIYQQSMLDEKSTDTFSLIKFSSNITTVIDNELIINVKKINDDQYFPYRNTALYDAIGFTITNNASYNDVMLVIITDGMDNASKEYRNIDVIKKMLKEKEEKNNWKIVYLSADLSTVDQGNNLGIFSSPHGTTTATQNVCVGYNNIPSSIKLVCQNVATEFRTKGTMTSVGMNMNEALSNNLSVNNQPQNTTYLDETLAKQQSNFVPNFNSFRTK